MTRRNVSLLVALLVALSGCSALGLPSLGGPDLPVDPPGVEASGVTSPDALVDAHQAAVAEAGFAAELHYVVTAPNWQQTADVDYRASPGLERFRVLRDEHLADGRTVKSDLWGNRSVGLARNRYDGRLGYSKAYPTRELATGESDLNILGEFLALGDYGVQRVETDDGTTLVTLQAESASADAAVPSTGIENVSSFSATVTVDGDGVIHSARVDARADGRRYELRYDLTQVGGTAVERPDWLAAAAADVPKTDLSFTVEDGMAVVTNEGGAPVPTGTALRVFARTGDQVVVDTVRLQSPSARARKPTPPSLRTSRSPSGRRPCGERPPARRRGQTLLLLGSGPRVATLPDDARRRRGVARTAGEQNC
ncbi:hypothetical protein ACFQH6_05475 [Halobacteriaceae archaeon GCM10025711]